LKEKLNLEQTVTYLHHSSRDPLVPNPGMMSNQKQIPTVNTWYKQAKMSHHK
jgi:hypothetical protein